MVIKKIFIFYNSIQIFLCFFLMNIEKLIVRLSLAQSHILYFGNQ